MSFFMERKIRTDWNATVTRGPWHGACTHDIVSLGRWSNLTRCFFPNGLVQPPTRDLLLETMHQTTNAFSKLRDSHEKHCGAIINGLYEPSIKHFFWKLQPTPLTPLPTKEKTKKSTRENPVPFSYPQNLTIHATTKLAPPKISSNLNIWAMKKNLVG